MSDDVTRPSRPLQLRPLALLTLVAAITLALASPAHAGWSNSAVTHDTPQWGSTADVEVTEVGWSVRNYKRRITADTNDYRRRYDVPTVRWRTCLNRQAQRWANYLARTGKFEHQNLQTPMNRCNLRGAGENLALGYTNPSATVRAWMNSSGHRANLLRDANRLTGVGMAKGQRGWVTVQLVGWQ